MGTVTTRSEASTTVSRPEPGRHITGHLTGPAAVQALTDPEAYSETQERAQTQRENFNARLAHVEDGIEGLRRIAEEMGRYERQRRAQLLQVALFDAFGKASR